MKRSVGEPRSMCVLACIAWCIVTGLDRKLKQFKPKAKKYKEDKENKARHDKHNALANDSEK
jgi:hypothetical protein